MTTPSNPDLIETKRGVRSWAAPAAAGLTALLGLSLSGCSAIGFAAESYRRNSTYEVKAAYEGLAGKSFAVIVTADRTIQADHPGLIDRLTIRISERLSDPKNIPRAGAFARPEEVLRVLYDRPGWSTMTMAELADAVGGVERLVYIEIYEYRLNEPGNAYEWEGIASGSVSVIETDSSAPEVRVFEQNVSVRFPTIKGVNVEQVAQAAITSELSRRFIDRASWLFYNHQEPYYPEY
jgi:hypothetical protein